MNTYEIFTGDVLDKIKSLSEKSIQCCVTSPPYYGLRQYLPDGHESQSLEIGLEESPEAYVENLVAVFREVRRVLKDDGTLWLNLGDSYNGSGKGGNPEGSPFTKQKTNQGSLLDRPTRISGLKPKDLIGIPWMVAFALRADGWYLRSDIIWQKPNPMPESVTDRPTKSHEHIFLLSKSRDYYYDYKAILEPTAYDGRKDTKFKGSEKYKDSGQTFAARGHERWSNKIVGQTEKKMAGTGYGGDGKGLHGHSGYYSADGTLRMNVNADGIPARNKRDVWTVSTKPYSGAHFATFPTELIEPCILAGTSESGECPHCGTAWVRIVERVAGESVETPKTQAAHEARGGTGKPVGTVGKSGGGRIDGYVKTLGWEPQCDCPEHHPVPQTVLDVFNGSGTTGEVSLKNKRNYIGFELNPEYVKLTHKRLAAVQQTLF